MVPTLCVGTGSWTLRRPLYGAQERHRRHSHAELGTDRALHVLDSARRVLG